jgi:hypothetical protein
MLPSDVWTGWIDDFRQWVEPTTDGSYEGIFAVGSLIASIAIGRSVGIHYGRPTYPNLYLLTIGATGVPRKTTVVSRGQDILKKAFTEDFLRLSRSIGSGEGLLEYFCNEEKDAKTGKVGFEPIAGQRVLLDEPEFCNLLKKARRPGTANITETLLTIFDGDDFSPRTRSRSIKVVQPFFSLITTTTPENLETSLSDVDIESGLIPRFANFYCTPREPIAYPSPPDETTLSTLANGLGEISRHGADIGTKSCALSLSSRAKLDWELTFKDIVHEMRDERSAVSSIIVRVPAMIMKWSLIYAIQAGEAEITEESLARATLVGTYLMETARLVPSSVHKCSVARIEARIVDTLNRMRGQYLTTNQIHRLVSGRIKAEELRRSLDSLAHLGVIQVGTTDGTKKTYGIG